MLTKRERVRIESRWLPDEWPAFADQAYAAAGHRRPFVYYLARIQHLGLSGARFMEAGCGTGRWCFAFTARFDHVKGFDLTTSRVDTANWLKKRFSLKKVEFSRGDIRAMPAEDNSLDVIYSNSVAIGGVPLEAILRECFRVLKPGGICYIGLNGPGYARSLVAQADPKVALMGRQRVYNDICEPRLSALAPSLAPGGVLNQKLNAQLALGGTPVEVLTNISASPEQVRAAELIDADLGADFTQTLLDDFRAIAAGERTSFSHTKAGRGYEPSELHTTARSVGFARFEWALDGCLSLQRDGTVKKGPSPVAPGVAGMFQDHIRVYEALIWKPTA